MSREPWYESESPGRVARGAGWRIGISILAIILFFGFISIGIWFFKVKTSDVKGAGDATAQINSGVNRVNAQEWFHGQYGQIQAADRQLDELAANLAANIGKTDESFWRTNYSGVKNRCVEMVAVYNAEAQKISRAQWRDTALPIHIDTTDPKTDCRETIVEVTR